MVVVVIDRYNTEFSEVHSEQVKSSPKFTETQLVEIKKSPKPKMPVERRGVRALQIWCQRVTSDYPSVTITDMSTSWRVSIMIMVVFAMMTIATIVTMITMMTIVMLPQLK